MAKNEDMNNTHLPSFAPIDFRCYVFIFLAVIIYLIFRLLSRNIKLIIYKTIILHVVLYGCETWSLILREEHRLRVFENRVHNLYSSPGIIRMIKSRRMKFAGHVARMGEKRNAYRTLVGNPGGKRPLVRPRHRWVDNIKIDLREVGWDGMDWIDLAQDMDQWTALVNEPSGSIKHWEILEWLHSWQLLKKGSAP
jgi:hypothetical protein